MKTTFSYVIKSYVKIHSIDPPKKLTSQNQSSFTVLKQYYLFSFFDL